MKYDPKSSHAEEFISHEEIEETLAYGEANRANRALIDEILAKARERKGLSHREAMVLLDCSLEDKNQEIFELAEQIAGQLETKVFQAKIRTSVSVAEAPAHGISVVDYAPRSKPAQDFEALCDEVAGAAFPRRKEED